MSPLPKGFIKNIKLSKSSVGPEKRQDILDDIDNQGTFLPRGVDYADMDKFFIKMVKEDLSIVISGEKVPIIFLTIQRWSEISQTWMVADEFKDIKLPFITIVRRPDIQVGTNQDGNWNEAGIRKYTYIKIPTLSNTRKGVDVYKIPQPTSVDTTYEVRLFCNRMVDINKFSKKILHTFNSRQHYISPNGHPMPVHLEGISDESDVDDFENRRFYIQSFEMTLLGYLLDEDEFEIVPTVDRIKIDEELITTRVKPKVTFGKTQESVETVNYQFIIKPETNNKFRFKSDYDTKFIGLTLSNIDSVIFKVNGKSLSVPFVVNAGETITVKFVKDFYETGEFNLNGIIL